MSKYWEKRQAEKMLDVMDKADISTKYLEELYAKSSLYLNSKIQGIFDKYRRSHDVLTDVEAKTLLNSLVDKTSYDELLLKLKNGANSKERKELLKVLDAPAYRYRIQRLQETQKEVDSIMANVYKTEKNINTLTYVDVAFDSYYKDIYNIQENVGYGFQFNKLDVTSVDDMIKLKWRGTNYSERIWNNTYQLSQSLKEEMMLNLLSGKSEKDMITTITEKFSVGSYQARRLIETESAYVTNYIDQQVYEECGISKERFTAIHDLKTSKVCQNHDGNEVEINKGIIGETIPPLHPHCRSFMEPIISKEISNSLMRRERDIVTGEDSIVPANETYQQWLERQQRSNGLDTVETLQKKYANLSSDRQQYNRYTKVLGKEKMPISLDNFQDIKYNDVESFRDLRTQFKDKKLQINIQSDKYSKTVLEGKQGKHLLGHNNYIQGRSYINMSIEDIQKIVSERAGTGVIKRDSKGIWTHKEFIEDDNFIGVYVDNKTGKETMTKRFSISYSKNGVHVVPARPLDKEE